jgi:small subunit ribosomal protein S17
MVKEKLVSTEKAERHVRKTRTGVVISDSMDKTVVVKVDRAMRHPMYRKVVRSSKNYKAHDEKEACKVGDTVVITETRPISKTKRWRILEIITEKK